MHAPATACAEWHVNLLLLTVQAHHALPCAKLAQRLAVVAAGGSLIKQEPGLQAQPYGQDGRGQECRQPAAEQLSATAESDSGRYVSSPREGAKQGKLIYRSAQCNSGTK